MTINENELRSAIEAVLLVAGEPITLGALVEVFGEKEKESIEARLEEIRTAYEQSSGGFTLEQAAGGYRLVTRPEFDVYLKKFFSKQGEGRLSIAALETLAIVAYKQPITAPEIADIRGVNSAGVLRTLLDRKLIRIAGRKNVVGSPFLYKTTKDFLMHFGLNSIQDLPRLEEFAEILGDSLTEELLGSISEVESEGVDEIQGEQPDSSDEAPLSGTPVDADADPVEPDAGEGDGVRSSSSDDVPDTSEPEASPVEETDGAAEDDASEEKSEVE
jgi:segregation and condensation protein B